MRCALLLATFAVRCTANQQEVDTLNKHEAGAVERTITHLENLLEAGEWSPGTERGDLSVTLDVLRAHLAMFAPTTEGHPVA